MASPLDLINADLNLATLDQIITSDLPTATNREGRVNTTIAGWQDIVDDAIADVNADVAAVDAAATAALADIAETAAEIPEALSLVGTGIPFNTDITVIPTGGLIAGNWAVDLDSGNQFIWAFLGAVGYWWPMNPSYGTASHQALPERNGPSRHIASDIDMGGGESLDEFAGSVLKTADLEAAGSEVEISGVQAAALAKRYTEIVSVTEYGALGGSNNDTVAFTNALIAGNGYAFVPYRTDGYTVDGNPEGLWGFGNIRFNGNGLVRYTDVAQYGGYKNAAFYADVLARNGNIQISCFGDSTMYGYLVGAPLPTDQDVNNPPITLANTLRALFSGTITVLNEAISGSNMRNMMRDLRYEGKIAPGGTSAGSAVIYCNHCINNVQSEYSIDEFKKDYVDFVRITRKYGKVPVIVTPNPIVPIGGGDSIETRVIETYVNAMRDVAKITGCDIVDNYYYAMRTASRVPLTEMVPDGIHPSSQLYLQNGRNLAIPLISAAVLKNKGDIANIYSCSMKDTASSGVATQSGTMSGLNYNSTRTNGTVTGINFAVILDEKIDYLNVHALQWGSGARVKVRSFNFNTTDYWQTIEMSRQYGDFDALYWDSPFLVKSNGDSYAGLHVIEVSYDISSSDSVKNQMALNCISMPDQFSQSVGKLSSIGRFKVLTETLLTNQTMSLNYNFATLGGTGLIFTDLSGYQTLKIELTSGGAVTATYAGTFGGSTDTIISSGVTAGIKSVFVKIETNQVTVNVDGSQVVKAISSWMPPLRILNAGYVGLVTNN